MADRKLLQLDQVTKIFPGVVALDKVNFDLEYGEVHVLVGENGAGKSTLIKVLSGAHSPDRGSIVFEGKAIRLPSATKAQEAGIATIFQEFNLIPELTVAQNVFLGREPKRLFGTTIDWPRCRREAKAIFERLGIPIDVNQKVSSLSVSKQQMVEIAKALSINAKVIIFDEPTSALTSEDIKRLFEVIQHLKSQGLGIIYISHRLEELFTIGDRATIMRDGKVIWTERIASLNVDKIIKAMVGEDIGAQFPREYREPGKEMLRVEHLTSHGVFEDVNFHVREGEIVGFSGLLGSGRTEIMRAIFGIDAFDSGAVYIEGEKHTPDPIVSIKRGMAFIPEDRKNEGLCLGLPVQENLVHAAMYSLFPRGIVTPKKKAEIARKYVQDLRIKTSSLEQQVQYLSGGNQQKVVLSKWLLTHARIFVFDEPTRGIDVGAKKEFHRLMDELVAEGAAVIMISSELAEVLGMSDRVYVMKEGRLVKEFHRDSITQEAVLTAAIA